MTSSPIPAARSQYLLDLLAQVPDPRKRRGRRHVLAGLLAVGIAAVIAGSRSFAAIGQWAADAGPEVLAVLGAARGAAEESTFRRAFALVSPDVLDRVLGAWLWTRAVRADGRLVIAIDGKTVRGARNRDGKAPHLVAALAHGIGAVLGQVAVDGKSNEIPAVRDLLKAFASLASAVITTGAMHTQHDTAQVILGQGADYVMTVKANMPTLYRQLKKLPWAAVPAVSAVSTDHGRRARRTIKAVLAPAWIEFDGENRLHWVRDVTYQEDKSLVRTGTRPALWHHCLLTEQRREFPQFSGLVLAPRDTVADHDRRRRTGERPRGPGGAWVGSASRDGQSLRAVSAGRPGRHGAGGCGRILPGSSRGGAG